MENGVYRRDHQAPFLNFENRQVSPGTLYTGIDLTFDLALTKSCILLASEFKGQIYCKAGEQLALELVWSQGGEFYHAVVGVLHNGVPPCERSACMAYRAVTEGLQVSVHN